MRLGVMLEARNWFELLVAGSRGHSSHRLSDSEEVEPRGGGENGGSR